MAGIIKSGEFDYAAKGLQSVAFNFEDMSTRANEYLSFVRRQAEQILQEAKSEAAQIAAAARAEGQRAAVKEAQQQLGATLDHQLATLLPAAPGGAKLPSRISRLRVTFLPSAAALVFLPVARLNELFYYYR